MLSSGGNGAPQVEVFSPPYLFAGPRPTISAAPASLAFGQAFTVQTPDAATIGRVSLIRLGSVTHAFDQNQRLTPLVFTRGSGVLTVTAPANGNIAPPGDYMLFILNGPGVPSIARIVRLGGTASAPPPTGLSITALSPSSAPAGGAAFTLTVTGTGFVSGSTVRWKGAARTTTFVGTTQLRAAIPASDIAAAGTATISVTVPRRRPRRRTR